MAFTPITDPENQLREYTSGTITQIQAGQWFGAHNGLITHLLDLQNNQPYRHYVLLNYELYTRPNSYSLRHSTWRAGVIFPLKGDVAIEGNTVKSGGAIRPETGFLYPRCY